MASIERTAYPRLKPQLTDTELAQLYHPDPAELDFIHRYARGDSPRLTLLVLLKCHQHLGYLPLLKDIPEQVVAYLRDQLNMPPDVCLAEEAERSRYRYSQQIRDFLEIRPYSSGGPEVAEAVIRQSAYTMSDPADLINVAVEKLIEQRFELPAFSTLDRLVGRIRQEVHEQLYQHLTAGLEPEQCQLLEGMLIPPPGERITIFTRLKQVPGPPTLKQMRLWIGRLDWIDSLLPQPPQLQGIAPTKVRQFAAEAEVMEPTDMLDVYHHARRHSLLLCLIHLKRVQTKDQLATLLLKRMKRTHNRAQEKLLVLQQQSRELEERLLEAFSQVVHGAANEPRDDLLGSQVRSILSRYGGIATLSEQYRQVQAYHHNNYLPLLWDLHRPHRTALFQLLQQLDVQAASQDRAVLDAMDFVCEHRTARGDWLPCKIDLGFMSQRWQAFVQTRHQGKPVLKRRELEVAVFSHLADGLRSGDLYVPGSEEFADYREQLLSWPECEARLEAHCQALGLPREAEAAVRQLKTWLTQVAESVDSSYPDTAELTLDESGKPHLKRLPAESLPEGLEEFQEAVHERMPERHLLDVLKDAHHWVDYTRHFTPPSGSDPKMPDAVSRYLFTLFGYGCNLGANQTARHAPDHITPRILRRLNAQHITTAGLEAAKNDVITEYTRFDLPFLWGQGKTAIVDGTHTELIENNLLGERHIRYGGYGGVAYHHISDTYIALFSRFIACGVWEAVYILDGLMSYHPNLQPDTLHADTQGQSEPVFGLAHLLGIQLLPRMRNWNDVTFYRPAEDARYHHIDALFTETINWQRILTHWQDMMQVALSIQAGKVLPSTLLKKLGVYSRKNRLYQAFRELGRVLRTIFLLQYISHPPLRRQIRGETTKVESYHDFCNWVQFGGSIITSGDPVEQEKRVQYTDLVANIVMLHNVFDLTRVLAQMSEEGYAVTPEMTQRLSPYMTRHLKRFGQYVLDLEEIPEPLLLPKLPFV